MVNDYKEQIEESEFVGESNVDLPGLWEENKSKPQLSSSSDADVQQSPARKVQRARRRGCVHSTPYKISRVIGRMETMSEQRSI